MPNRRGSPEPAVSPDQAAVEQVFKALADPTRRRVVERLSRAPASTTELATDVDMALPSFLQHLQLLESCGLVASRKQGRVRTYRLRPEPLEQASGWLDAQRTLWERRMDQLDAHLATMLRPADDEDGR